MSAWKTSNAHNQFVAEIILKHLPEETDELSLRNLVQMLSFYNQLSLLRRYSDPIVIEPDTEIVIDPTWHEEKNEILASLSCYSYQTCEFRGYYNTEVYKWINKIQEKLGEQTSKVGETYWGLEEENLTQPYKAQERTYN